MTEAPIAWYVVYSRPRQEGAADAELRQLGYHTFYPFERVKRRRNLPHGKTLLEEVEVPHFPRYLFVGVEEGQGLYHANNAAAVSTVLYLGPEPLRVPEHVVTALMDACDESGAILVEDRTRRRRAAFLGKPGDNIKVLEGPFAGFLGCIESVMGYDKTGRIRVWVDVLGGAPAELEVEQVKVVGKRACA